MSGAARTPRRHASRMVRIIVRQLSSRWKPRHDRDGVEEMRHAATPLSSM